MKQETMKQEFEEISVCPHCNAPTEERFSGDEGWTFCPDGCGCLEGDKTVYKFLCLSCEEICDEEMCECQNPKPMKQIINHKKKTYYYSKEVPNIITDTTQIWGRPWTCSPADGEN